MSLDLSSPGRRNPLRPGHARPRRRGFSLVEILTVIGVIMILIGIAVVGYNALDKSSTTGATKTSLNTLKGMLTEYELRAGKTAMLGASAAQTTPTMGDVNQGGDGRAAAIANQQTIMAQLLRQSANQTVLKGLPSKSLVRAEPSLNPPVIADGWENPVIYVAAGGLTGVNQDGQPVRDDDGNAVPIKAPDNRPFFASAGQDGDFTAGDDNVYSFQQ